MRKALLLAVPAVWLFAGCASDPNLPSMDTRIANLESKVGILEKKLEAGEIPPGRAEAPPPTIIPEDDVRDVPGRVDDDSRPLTKKEIQISLRNAGFYRGPVDGVFGSATRKAIREFQRANDLKPDGIVGARTKKLMLRYL